MKRTQLMFTTLVGLVLAAPEMRLRQETPSGSLPFIGEDCLSSVCFPGQFEDCMGTKLYCESKGWERDDEPKQYESGEACLADRLPQATSDVAPGKPDAAASQCIVKVFTGGIDDDGNDEVILAPAVPCSQYREKLCSIDPGHDDSCEQCTKQCEGI